MSKYRILIVEDERHLAEGIKLNLDLDGYMTEVCDDGLVADEILQQENFDLIVLDIMLPGIDGFELCQRLRKRDDRTPILFLTARRQPEDRIHGLDIGGDDYIAKPFHLKELLSRIHAILRRKSWSTADGGINEITIGQTRIDLKKMHADGPNGSFDLSRREVIILKLLYERKGEPVSRSEILDRAWGNNQYPTDRTVDNFIVRLRQYVEENPGQPEYIRTVRGIGYRLES
jgi:two-component system alkaline phosphatase synthesis response regulator PhoP